MRKLILSASLSVMLIAVGCAAKPQAGGDARAAAAPVPQPDPKNPVIVHIVSATRTITVSSSPHGLLYSMKDASGNMQVADATPEKFAELEPELYQNIRHYIAVHADDAPIPSADIDAAIPTADTHPAAPSLNGQPRSFRGATSDEFKRTTAQPFPAARHDE